jgi:hypothetical protein
MGQSVADMIAVVEVLPTPEKHGNADESTKFSSQWSRALEVTILDHVNGEIDQGEYRASGVVPPFCGNALAPIVNTLDTAQLCEYLLTALVAESAPMIAPPVLWVLW